MYFSVLYFSQWRTFKFFDLQPDVDKGLLAAAMQVLNISNGFIQFLNLNRFFCIVGFID